MTVDLVPRGVRALSDHLNRYYRVWRGLDQDSLTLRLNTGGAFEVRNSASNGMLFRVDNTGASGSIVVPDNSITSAKIQDGTIATADMTINSIHGDRIQDGTIASTKITGGATIPSNSIDSSHILDGSIATADLAAHAVTQTQILPTAVASNTTSATFVLMAGQNLPITTVGGDLLCFGTGAATHSAAATNIQVGLQLDAAATVAGPAWTSSANVGGATPWSQVCLFTGVPPGPHSVNAMWLTVGGTQVTAYGPRMLVALELRR